MKITNEHYIKYGENFGIFCYSYETQYNWGHKVKIYKNDRLVAENKITYCNRTWERYRYQSCILGAIHELRRYRIAILLDEYKSKTGRKRLNDELKEIVIADDPVIAEYDKMYDYFDKEY